MVDLHNTKTEEHNQTDLDAQLEVQVPEYHCGEHGQKQIGGGVEAIGIVGEVDDGFQVAACGCQCRGLIPQRSDIVTDAERQHGRCSVADELNDQDNPQRGLVVFVGTEQRNEVDDEGGSREGSAEGDDGDLNGDILQDGF